jgi:alkylhydroperoxidase/carboxymuconolactone decarboxylase family protein YurZ
MDDASRAAQGMTVRREVLGDAHGLTPEQIAEVFLHTAVYAGMPAVNRAFAVAQHVLAEAG